MQNGKMLFLTSSFRYGLASRALPHVTLDIGLQLNIAPGVYAIETLVVEPAARAGDANGPWVHVTVQAGKSFSGEMQMNAEMVLRPPARSDLRLTLDRAHRTVDSDDDRTAQRAAFAALERPCASSTPDGCSRVWLWPRCRVMPRRADHAVEPAPAACGRA